MSTSNMALSDAPEVFVHITAVAACLLAYLFCLLAGLLACLLFLHWLGALT